MESTSDSDNGNRKQFGTRFLNNQENVFQHNAWDNVQWDEEQEKKALESVAKNSQVTLSQDELQKLDDEADQFWDAFYDIHENKFFKDRHWLFTEFPELNTQSTASDGEPLNRSIFEIGCGVGNTILPIVKHNIDPHLKIFGCDFSPKAINILQNHADFDHVRGNVFVLDVTAPNWDVPFPEASIDIIVSIFVLSAIHPDKMKIVIQNCFKYLKPGGCMLFRDYGRHDLAQLRFKPGKCLQENFYVRGDGTRVYFFTQAELKDLFEQCGFEEELNLIDRRLQVNRGKQLKMYRVWIQTKFRKPEQNSNS